MLDIKRDSPIKTGNYQLLSILTKYVAIFLRPI